MTTVVGICSEAGAYFAAAAAAAAAAVDDNDDGVVVAAAAAVDDNDDGVVAAAAAAAAPDLAETTSEAVATRSGGSQVHHLRLSFQSPSCCEVKQALPQLRLPRPHPPQ